MEKYLSRYAEPEAAALDGLSQFGPWQNVLVIPACNETADFLRNPPPVDGRSLLILVINEVESASTEISLRNQALAATVQTRFDLLWQPAMRTPGFGLNLFRDPRNPRDVLLVDRFSQGHKLPHGGGVGHARKAGADIATALIHSQQVLSPWIHCTDADVHLPESYFSCIGSLQNSGPEYAALIYPFHHSDKLDRAENTKVILATQLYELSLRYYVAGMKYALSPYAFHTIGSTMAVNAKHYASVRGFPKREAGEDFYLLNKLAKVGAVFELVPGPACAAIEIESRRSDRVPFGTGAAVNKMTDLTDLVDEFQFYDPGVFELLKMWLQVLPVIWQSGSSQLTASLFPVRPGGSDQNADQLSLLEGLNSMGTEKALNHAFRQSKDLEQFLRQMHTWFDAFRTLKLIHYLRDHHLPTINLATLEANNIFCKFLSQDPVLRVFHQRLHKIIG